MSQLYPVKVYDGEGNLLRIISVEELKKKANEDFKNFGYIAKQKQQKKCYKKFPEFAESDTVPQELKPKDRS